jgi:N-terminal domain of anti-restriction factor ArdC
MSHPAARTRAGQDRTSLYSEITGKIIAELEAGRVPWVQPWGTASAKAPLAMPKNAATQRRYSGVNVLILWNAVIARGFAGQSWLTFRQALSLGGNVRKGEHGTAVVYADRFIPDDERKRAELDGDEPSAIPFLKRRARPLGRSSLAARRAPTCGSRRADRKPSRPHSIPATSCPASISRMIRYCRAGCFRTPTRS